MSKYGAEQATADIELFSGIMTAIDPANVPDGYASDALNVRIEGGSLYPRYGYGNLKAAVTNFESCQGLFYASGYDGSANFVEDYIAFIRLSTHTAGKCRPYRYNLGTSTWVPITYSGGTAPDLDLSHWRVATIRNKAYFINDNGSLYSYVIGDTDSLVLMDAPDKPTGLWTLAKSFYATRYDLTATDASSASEMTMTGAARQSTSSTDSATRTFNIQHNRSGTTTGASSIAVICDGGAGRPAKLDMYASDFLWFNIKTNLASTLFALDPNQFAISVTNDDGLTFVADTVYVYNNSKTNFPEYWVRAEFKNKTRSQWGNGSGTGKINGIIVSYFVTKNSSASDLGTTVYISMPVVGGVNPFPDGWEEKLTDELTFGYTAYNSTTGWESDMADVKGITYASIMGGYQPYYYAPPKLTFSIPAGFSDADKWRLYLRDEDGVFRLVMEQADSSLSYILVKNYAEMLAGTIYEPKKFETDSPMSCAGRFRGSMVWGIARGEDNVAFSRVTDAEALSTVWDEEDDLDKGETYSLSDSFDDYPIGLMGFGDYLFLLGQNRVYWQIGDRPSNMSNPAPVPASYGVAGYETYCAWKDDSGTPVLAYLDKYGGFWAIAMSGGGPVATELSLPIRGLIKAYLADEQSLSLANASVFSDTRTNTLWITLGTRALMLSAPHEFTGKRSWMKHNFNLSGISWVASSFQRGVVWVRSDGKLDEAFWKSSSSEWYDGTLIDGGSEMPEGYWESGEYYGPNVRVDHLQLYSDNKEDHKVTVTSTRQTETYTWNDYDRYCRTSPWQQGWKHKFKIHITESESVKGFSFKIRQGGRRLNA